MDDRPERVSVLIEVPKGSFLKRERQGDRWVVDYPSPLPSPFNYGCVPGSLAPDDDPQDVIVLGPRLGLGSRVELPVVGIVRFLDDGCSDHKWIASQEALTESQIRHLTRFFRLYAVARRVLNRLRGSTGATRFLGVEDWFSG